MTHEDGQQGEEPGGPEHTHHLPDAGDVPVYADPAGSDAPPLTGEEW